MNRDERVLITGGTGFLGGRLVERLAASGQRIRVGTSDFRHCSRVSRFALEMVRANLRDPASLERAVAGCRYVFHFGYQFGGTPEEQRRANIEGTAALAEAALQHGVSRFVHISSIAAYGPPTEGELDETSAPRPSADPYADTKQRIEQRLRQLHRQHGLPLVILQPTIVYGPYAATWTTRLIEQVRNYRVVLPPDGLCNAVYVDDVISAALLAAEREAAIGEAFLISGAAPVTWRDFYGAYEKMCGRNAVVVLDEKAARLERRRQRRLESLRHKVRKELARRPGVRQRLLHAPPQRWLLALGRALLPLTLQRAIARKYQALWQLPSEDGAPVYVPEGATWLLYRARTQVRIEKARRLLGYTPAFDLARGMALTEAWARWAGLLP